jgi:hypothetical protein
VSTARAVVAHPRPDTMYTLGIAVSYLAEFLVGLLLLRGIVNRLYRLYPLFYSYIAFGFCCSLALYVVRWRFPAGYPSAFWIYYLINILVEFTVLVEISDQIFKPYAAIRNLGRAITAVISLTLGVVYVLPIVLVPGRTRHVLLEFSLRAAATKAIILCVLFLVARHYGSRLGRNLGGIMLGFSVYMAIEVVVMAAATTFGSALYARVLWFMSPIEIALCLLVWTVSLWNFVPVPVVTLRSAMGTGKDAQAVALELSRFNNDLSKLMNK